MKRDKRGISMVVVLFAVVGGIGLGLAFPKFLSWVLSAPRPITVVSSGSMRPVFKVGDLTVIRGIWEIDDIRVGDIVAFIDPDDGASIIHRVVEVRVTDIITKGDANFFLDPPVPFGNIEGRVITFRGKLFRIPWVGFITMFVNRLERNEF